MFVGVDLHKKMAVYTAVDDAGNVIGEGATENTLEGWEKFGQLFPPGTSVALEACVNWGQVCDALEGHGLRPALANSKRVRMIAESKSKTDRIDSRSWPSSFERSSFRKSTSRRRRYGVCGSCSRIDGRSGRPPERSRVESTGCWSRSG